VAKFIDVVLSTFAICLRYNFNNLVGPRAGLPFRRIIMPQPKFQFLLCLLMYTLIVRLLPYVLMNCDIKTDPSVLYYPWNFSPMTAVCLFGGAFLADRRTAFLLPLATLFLSDLGIVLVSGRLEWGFPVNAEGVFTLTGLGRWAFTYFSFAIAVVLGSMLRNSKFGRFPAPALALGLTFETVFFIVSNFLVWTGNTTGETPLYPATAAGLGQCYLIGLPFFGKSLLGTAAFTMLLFSPLGVRAATESEGDLTSRKLVPVRVK
jgi:hypothetical protein